MRYFGPFLILLLLVALFFRVEFFFTILYLLAAIVILARLWMRRAIKQLQGGRRFVDRAFTDDRVPVRLTIKNDGWLPLLWLEIDELVPLGLRATPFERRVVALGPGETWQADYTLICYRRGRYHVGPTTLRTGDPLGIARHELRWSEPDDLVVYPRIVPLAQLGLPTRSPLAILPATAPLFEDTSRVMSTRDYRRGDPLRRVHWSATARVGHLVVKQYQPAIARETMICLDLHAGDYAARFRHDAIELAIVVAASIANHAIVREGLPIGLTTQIPPSASIPAASPPDAASVAIPEAGSDTPVLVTAPIAAAGGEGGAPASQRARAPRSRGLVLPARKERAHLTLILETLAEVEMLADEVQPFTSLLRRERLGLSWGSTVAIVTGRGSTDLSNALLGLRRGGLAVALILVGISRPTDGAADWSPPPGVATYCVNTIQDLEALA